MLTTFKTLTSADIGGNLNVSGNTTIAGSISANEYLNLPETYSNYLDLSGGIVTGDVVITGSISANEYLGILWDEVDKTTSDIADLTTKSHTSLSDIGTNTHAEIDTFIGITIPSTYLPLSGGVVTGDVTVDNLSTTGDITTDGNITANEIITSKIYPPSDSLSALQILKADGITDVVTVDTTNGYVGIGTIVPATSLHVAGTTAANYIQSDVGINLSFVAVDDYLTTALITDTGNVDEGTHYYGYTYTTALGETEMKRGAASLVTTDATHKQVTVTFPVSTDYRVTGRKLYRSQAGQAFKFFYLLATIADNTTTEYTDNIADASLGADNKFRTPNTTNSQILIDGATAMFLGEFNTIFGQEASPLVADSGGHSNTIIGKRALYSLTTGHSNTALGTSAGYNITTSINNVFFGSIAGYRSTGSYNAFFGSYAGYGEGNTNTGGNNTMIGSGAGYSHIVGALSNNTLLGRFAGRYLAGSNNVFLGYNAGYDETGSDTLIIDSYGDRTSEALGRTSALIYGKFDATPANQILALGGGGKVGVGTIIPFAQLHAESTTEQLRLGYDATNYMSTTVNSTGGVSVDAVGSGAEFTFSNGADLSIEFKAAANSIINVPFATIVKKAGVDQFTVGGGSGNYSHVDLYPSTHNAKDLGLSNRHWRKIYSVDILASGTLSSTAGRIRATTRVTTTYSILTSDDNIYCNTTAGDFTVTLPAGVDGQTFRIINSGTGTLTIAPNGTELLTGANASKTANAGTVIVLVYETTDGWF